MKSVIITGSAGLVGLAASKLFLSRGFKVIGIDNNFRETLFGPEASVGANTQHLLVYCNYEHHQIDIRDYKSLESLFSKDVVAVIHTAAQPSHDWAAKDPKTDFSINAKGTMNLLEATRLHCPEAVFIFTSTNKVYGDLPNRIRLLETPSRFVPASSKWKNGISEDMSIDGSMHSLFGVSKASADLMVQEYGRYFGIRTACFRCGCITGKDHSGVKLHGFMSYLLKSVASKTPYEVIGYGGKQVRDNIHADDLASAMYEFFLNPKVAAVYNMGGGLESNCSILELLGKAEELFNTTAIITYSNIPRKGDHKWYISDTTKFKKDYPNWSITKSIKDILNEYRT